VEASSAPTNAVGTKNKIAGTKYMMIEALPSMAIAGKPRNEATVIVVMMVI